MKKFAALVVAGVLAVAGCSDSEPTEAAETSEPTGAVIEGSIGVVGSSTGPATDCSGKDGFDDMTAGAEVTVRNGEGDIVGTSELESGTSEQDIVDRLVAGGEATQADVEELLEFGDGWFCPLFFEIEVADAEFYEIEVGRRDVTISKADLEAADWQVHRTLDGL